MPGVSLLPILEISNIIDSVIKTSIAISGFIYSFFINLPVFVFVSLICHFSGKPSTRLKASIANSVILSEVEGSLHSRNKILRCAQDDKIDYLKYHFLIIYNVKSTLHGLEYTTSLQVINSFHLSVFTFQFFISLYIIDDSCAILVLFACKSHTD